MNRIKTKQYIVAILLCCFFVVSCAHKQKPTFKQAAYKTLTAAATSYEQTMSALGDYYKRGKISEATKNKIIEAANVYWGAYHSAVLAFEVYERSNTLEGSADKVEAEQKLQKALAELNQALFKFLELSNEYLSRLKKIEK